MNDCDNLSQQCVPSVLPLSLQAENLLVQLHYQSLRPVHRSYQSRTLPFPPLDAVDLGASAAVLGLDLLTQATHAALMFGHVDQFHAACLAGPVFIVAAMGEASPAPVSAYESFLIVKTHAYLRVSAANDSDAKNLT